MLDLPLAVEYETSTAPVTAAATGADGSVLSHWAASAVEEVWAPQVYPAFEEAPLPLGEQWAQASGWAGLDAYPSASWGVSAGQLAAHDSTAFNDAYQATAALAAALLQAAPPTATTLAVLKDPAKKRGKRKRQKTSHMQIAGNSLALALPGKGRGPIVPANRKALHKETAGFSRFGVYGFRPESSSSEEESVEEEDTPLGAGTFSYGAPTGGWTQAADRPAPAAVRRAAPMLQGCCTVHGRWRPASALADNEEGEPVCKFGMECP